MKQRKMMVTFGLLITVPLMTSCITCVDNNSDVEQEIINLKELVSALKHDSETLMSENIQLEARLDKIEESKASTYIRWGRSSCAKNGSETVYIGYMAGKRHDISGGGTEFLCLPEQPSWGEHGNSDNKNGQVFSVEYEMNIGINLKHEYNYNAPCCLCKTNYATTVMIPGLVSCFDGWHLQYIGYLGAGQRYGSATNYVCVDSNPKGLPGTGQNEYEATVHNVEIQCGSLNCPPYVNNRQLACVVCSL